MATTSTFILLVLMVTQIYGTYVQVEVAQGTLQGEVLYSSLGFNYTSFKGVPYAKPPTGDLRFKAPEAPVTWEGVRNATEHGANCPHVNTLTGLYVPGSEDCLFLNIYTPNMSPDTPLRTIFYIYSGGYKFGSADSDIYGPEFILTEDTILVTINHRLDTLGFLSLGNCDVPGNAGLKDQVAALKWVQKNIANFGGSSENVTLVGGGSGGASVGYHLISPMSKGLFQNAVLMSGAPTSDWDISYQPVRRAFNLAASLGNNTQDKTELLAFLQEVPYKDLIDTHTYVLNSEPNSNISFKMQQFAPVIEVECPNNTLISIDPMTALDTGNFSNDVDVMCGYNNMETLIVISSYNKTWLSKYNNYIELFVPSKLTLHTEPDTSLEIAVDIINNYFGGQPVTLDDMAKFINVTSITGIALDANRFCRRYADVTTKNVIFYILESYSARNKYGVLGLPFNITGNAHLDDVYYLFNATSMPIDTTSTEYEMVQTTTKLFANFAKYGTPTPDSSLGVTCPTFNTTTLAYLKINETLSIGYGPDNYDYLFMQKMFKKANVTF